MLADEGAGEGRPAFEEDGSDVSLEQFFEEAVEVEASFGAWEADDLGAVFELTAM